MKLKISLGAHIDDVGSTTKNKTGGWRTFKPIIDMKKCIDCGSCWVFCPDASIERVKGEYVVDYDFCKGCGICANECPSAAIEMILEEK